MASADGQLQVTFNGEIYNHRELRRSLEATGHVFRSQSDTEVLLQLYSACGERMVDELRGMFAFAIWDNAAQRMFLARDTYGIKPLYYADDGWTFRFASQVKALLAGGSIPSDPDSAGRCGFYLWGNVPEPFTSYQKIRALPAGSTMFVDALGAHEQRQYRSVASIFALPEVLASHGNAASPDETDARLRGALVDSVRHHLVADVPVGIFLSAGIDSSALLGLMRDAGADNIRSVTVAFEEFRGTERDESVLAAQSAKQYNTRHHERVVTYSEFKSDLPEILAAMDQPSIDGINTWFVSKAAREIGLKVAISGLGGDELFGGYSSFAEIPAWVNLLKVPAKIPFAGRALRNLLNSLPIGCWGVSPKFAAMLEYGGSYAGAYYLRRGLFMPWQLEELLDAETARDGLDALNDLIESANRTLPKSAFSKLATLEASLYMRNQLLRDTDWSSMAHGVEVRVPLVDPVLSSTVANLGCGLAPPGIGKAMLARAPTTPLPSKIAERPKTGFETPIASWMEKASLTPMSFQGSVRDGRGRASRSWSKQVAALQWSTNAAFARQGLL